MTSVTHLPADPRQPHSGEVEIEIAPLLETGSADADLADRIDALLRRACKLARALTGAECLRRRRKLATRAGALADAIAAPERDPRGTNDRR